MLTFSKVTIRLESLRSRWMTRIRSTIQIATVVQNALVVKQFTALLLTAYRTARHEL